MYQYFQLKISSYKWEYKGQFICHFHPFQIPACVNFVSYKEQIILAPSSLVVVDSDF